MLTENNNTNLYLYLIDNYCYYSYFYYWKILPRSNGFYKVFKVNKYLKLAAER